jgi:hypothetical protein
MWRLISYTCNLQRWIERLDSARSGPVMLAETAKFGQNRTKLVSRERLMKIRVLGILIMLLASSRVSACSCGIATLDNHIDKADAVYLATLQQAKLVKGEYEKEWPYIEGTFQVHRTLKGRIQTESMTLTTPMWNASCGVIMVVSATYLIFKTEGRNSITACDGSSVIESFQEEEVAAKVKAELGKTGRTSGLK